MAGETTNPMPHHTTTRHHEKKPTKSNDPRAERARTHSISLYITDPSVKDKLKAAAEAEGRTMANWYEYHIMPGMLARIEECLAKKPQPPAPLLPARHVTMFEKLKADAEQALITRR